MWGAGRGQLESWLGGTSETGTHSFVPLGDTCVQTEHSLAAQLENLISLYETSFQIGIISGICSLKKTMTPRAKEKKEDVQGYSFSSSI